PRASSCLMSAPTTSGIAATALLHRNRKCSSEQIGQNLQRVAIQFGVAGLINFAHATLAERREYFIGTETRTGGEAHFRSNSFGQLTIRVIGATSASSKGWLMRKRLPSSLTSYSRLMLACEIRV